MLRASQVLFNELIAMEVGGNQEPDGEESIETKRPTPRTLTRHFVNVGDANPRQVLYAHHPIPGGILDAPSDEDFESALPDRHVRIRLNPKVSKTGRPKTIPKRRSHLKRRMTSASRRRVVALRAR